MKKFLTTEQRELVDSVKDFITGFELNTGKRPTRVVLDARRYSLFKTVCNKKRLFPEALGDVDLCDDKLFGIPVVGQARERARSEQTVIA